MILAKADLYRYFRTIEDQYFQMCDEIQEFDKEYAQGLVDSTTMESAKAMLQPLKENYERISYCLWLLNIPKFIKRKSYLGSKELVSAFKHNTLEDIKLENEDILKRFKETYLKGEPDSE